METPLSKLSDVILGLYNRHIPLTLNMSINDIGRGVEQVFEIDYELQFEKSFLTVIQRFFDVLGWGTINLKVSKMKKLIKF